MKRRGGGSIFKRGGAFWIKFYRHGQPIRESVAGALGKRPGDVTERDASQLLNQRLGKIARGEPLALRAERVRVGELLDDLITEYKVNGRRSLDRLEDAVAHLRPVFGHVRAQQLDTAAVRTYIADRQAATEAEDGTEIPGASNATINRELAALTRALRLGQQAGKILTHCHVPKLVESSPRAGFTTREQFAAVRRHLPEELRVAMTVAYTFGWRKREVLDLQRHQYDSQAGTLRLEPGSTKNGDGRVVHATPELRAMLDARVEWVRALERTLQRVIPWLFPHLDEPTPRERSRTDCVGQRIRDPRKAWASACRAAGLPGLLIHDLRRSAVRNMEAAGVPRSVAMKLTGHKTETVYRRYAIVSDADLQAAAQRLAAAEAAPAAAKSGEHRPLAVVRAATGTITGTISGSRGGAAALASANPAI